MAPRTPKDSEKKPAKAARAAKVPKIRPKAEPDGAAEPVATGVSAAQGGAVKLKDLIASVVLSTGGKKPEVKAAVEATLAALAEVLAAGKSLAVPPLGKLRVVKAKGPALTLKLRRMEGAKAAGLALADDGEDG